MASRIIQAFLTSGNDVSRLLIRASTGIHCQAGAWTRDVTSLQKQDGGSAPSLTAGVAPYPPFPGLGQDFARGYIMSGGTQHPDQAWAWRLRLGPSLIR